MAGTALYGLLADTLRWSARGTTLLERPRPRRRPAPMDAVAATIRVKRASDLSRYARLRLWLWMARGHQWRTRWAAFDWYVTAEIDGRLVSAAGIVDRWGTVGGALAHLGLLGGVFTAPEHRRHGLAGKVVRRSTEIIANEIQCDFGVLTTAPRLFPLYDRLGWKHVSNVLAFVRFGEPGVHGGAVMVCECAGRSLPAGTIDVLGLPA